tara:strand:- start:304 stop:576 length:273 start_codon:yes stop_codon:yes gene_type:complete
MEQKNLVCKEYKFLKAVNKLKEERNCLLPNKKNLSREVQKFTPHNLNETTILKILLDENRNVEYFRKVTNNRGTDYRTQISSYSVIGYTI